MVQRRTIAALTDAGNILLVEDPIPPLQAGMVLVEVRASLVSPGTELGGWRTLSQKQKPRGDSKAERSDQTLEKFGYANAGVVLAMGDGVTRFRVGDRIACMGAGYALHATHAMVPQNLCALLPENVSFAQGTYMHLAATALQAVRRGEPQLGEYAAVVGLGIVGQLTARLYQLAGAYVIGWDRIPLRLETAKTWGIGAVALGGSGNKSGEEDNEVSETKHFTGNHGLDAAVICFGGSADKAMKKLLSCMKTSPDGHGMGRIVIVGGMYFPYSAETNNIDIRRSARTGPGYHDTAWETGTDYPSVFVRWSTRAHMELALRLMSEGKLDVDALTTHIVPFAEITGEIPRLLVKPDDMLGVVFEMGHSD